MKPGPKKICSDSSGAAVIEFCFMLPLFVIMIVFVLYSYAFISRSITCYGEVRHALRVSADRESPEFPHTIIKQKTAAVSLPRGFGLRVGKTVLQAPIQMSVFAGCGQGLNQSRFQTGELQRKTDQCLGK